MNQEYQMIQVESYYNSGFGLHGGCAYKTITGSETIRTLDARCVLEGDGRYIYLQGLVTKFLIRAKITKREGRTAFVYSHYKWSFKVLHDL